MSAPAQSLAIIFTDKEKAEAIREPVPEPGPGEVRLKATWSLISTGTETICYGRRFAPDTHWDTWVKYPFRTGYSMCGQVDAVGSGVEGIKPGDRFATGTTHRQYYIRKPEDLFPIPDGVSDRDAAWFMLAHIVQNGVRHSEHELGEHVVVVGLGPLGQLAAQFVNLMGPRTLTAIDPVEGRLKLAAANGATHTLALGVDEAIEAVKEITGGRMADTVYDMTGNDKVFAGAQQLLRVRGTLSLIGDTGTPSGQHLTPAVIRNNLRIVASHATNFPPVDSVYAPWTRTNMIALFLDYVRRGRMNVGSLNTHVFSPAEPQAAYQKLLHDRADTMGCHFDWTQLT